MFLISSTPKTFAALSSRGRPTAAPAGETCLNEVAAGRSRAAESSLTSAQEFRASSRLMYPGEPDRTTVSIESESG
jgi:hypothetical protein